MPTITNANHFLRGALSHRLLQRFPLLLPFFFERQLGLGFLGQRGRAFLVKLRIPIRKVLQHALSKRVYCGIPMVCRKRT